MKLCIDCAHASAHGGTIFCKAPEMESVSLVDGTKNPPSTCSFARIGWGNDCGKDGKYFRPIETGSETVNHTPGPIVEGEAHGT